MSHDEPGPPSDTAALLRDASQRVWRQARELAHVVDELRENLPGPMARVRKPSRPSDPVSPVPALEQQGEPPPIPRTAALAAGIAAGIAAVGVVVALSIRRRRG